MEEEEKIVKGDDVVVDLDATLEDLYMGGSLKVRSHLVTVLTSELMHLFYISAGMLVYHMPFLNFC